LPGEYLAEIINNYIYLSKAILSLRESGKEKRERKYNRQTEYLRRNKETNQSFSSDKISCQILPGIVSNSINH